MARPTRVVLKLRRDALEAPSDNSYTVGTGTVKLKLVGD